MTEEEQGQSLDVEAALSEALDIGSDLAAAVEDYTATCEELNFLEKRKAELKDKIIASLRHIGATSMKVAGRTIGLSSRTYYGWDRNRIEEARAWLRSVDPSLDVPATNGIGKALRAYMDENPGADVPDFITSSETVTLTNSKAR